VETRWKAYDLWVLTSLSAVILSTARLLTIVTTIMIHPYLEQKSHLYDLSRSLNLTFNMV